MFHYHKTKTPIMNFSSFGSAFSGINHKFDNFANNTNLTNFQSENQSNRFHTQNNFISTPTTSIPSSSGNNLGLICAIINQLKNYIFNPF